MFVDDYGIYDIYDIWDIMGYHVIFDKFSVILYIYIYMHMGYNYNIL